jgi:hypothetical protein
MKNKESLFRYSMNIPTYANQGKQCQLYSSMCLISILDKNVITSYIFMTT